jgi:ubiquinone biosynthesis protein
VGFALARELQRLQTEVPADDAATVRERIEQELGRPLADIFTDFDDCPLASASIGQVHRARLHNGDDVAVKVQRAGIEDRVRIDMDILAGLAQFAERIPELQPYRPQAAAAEFQRTIRRELDFMREVRNMEQFAANFGNNPHVHIPRVYAHLSTSRVLTMEFLDGVKLADIKQLNGHGFDLSELARYGSEMYLEMIFHHGFYHGDPHPGNLVLLPGNTIGLLDFGMVGRLGDALRENIEDMLMAIATNDAQQLTSLVMRVGATPFELDEAALSVDLTDYVAHYGNQPIDVFDLAGALNEMIDIVQRYHIVLPAGMAMLLKVLVMLDGTVRLLEPRFSLMELIEPYRKKLVLRRMSPVRQVKKMRRIAGELELLAEVMPRRIRDILQQVQTGKFDVHLDHRGLEPSVNRLVLGMLTSALFLGSTLMITRTVWPFHGVSVPGTLGCIMSVALGMRLLRAIGKSGRLDRR